MSTENAKMIMKSFSFIQSLPFSVSWMGYSCAEQLILLAPG